MLLRYVLEPSIPPLAWCAAVEPAAGLCTIRHGNRVQTRTEWFVEGAWDARFAEGGFPDAPYFIGSGGRLGPGGMVFSTPTHTLERLHWVKLHDTIIVSNSLAATLSASLDDLAQDYPYYEADLMSFVWGPERATPRIPTASGRSINLVYVANLIVTPNGATRVVPKIRPEIPLSSFNDYAEDLQGMVSRIAANGSDRDRNVAYRLLGSISSGYDSPACAVLAKRAGCDEAWTFATARPGVKDLDDSGSRIGERLGISVLTYDRSAYLCDAAFPEAEFLATGTGGEDVVMAAVGDRLTDRLLVTGFLGDTVWGLPKEPTRSRPYQMSFPGGGSLGEFRLRTGFLHLPIPQLQHPRVADIRELSSRRELAQWRLGNDYDRPIPRRITEEAGIPRDWFGVEKKAVTQPFYWGQPVSSLLSASSADDFNRFVAPQLRSIGPVRHFRHELFRVLAVGRRRISWRRELVERRLGRPVTMNPDVPGRYLLALNPNFWLVHWGHERIKHRYDALRTPPGGNSSPTKD